MTQRRVIMGILIGVVVLSLVAAVLFTPESDGIRRLPGERVVGLLYIEGPITGGRSGDGLFGGSVGSDDIVQRLRQVATDPDVRALVIRLNTPGGSAAASQEIGVEITRLREAGKVVVASMGDVAASGGYWIAANSDHIVANPASLTGSIGVIVQYTNMEELYEKLGIAFENITSGEYKDMGSGQRSLTDAERAIYQSMVDDIFEQFIDVVADGRAMPPARVRTLADGRVYTGRQALSEGLVDELGNLHDAIHRAAELAGVADAYTVRELSGRKGLWDMLLGGTAQGWFDLQGLPAEARPTLMRWVLFPRAR